MSTQNAKFANNLRRLREERGLSQKALAELAGITQPTSIARYEAGRVTPRPGVVSDLASVLKVKVDDLLGLAEPGNDNRNANSSDGSFLDMLARQQDLLAEQQAMMAEQQAMLERQRQDVSRLTEMLARQQEEAIAEREFARRVASEQIDRLEATVAAVQRDLTRLTSGDTEEAKLSVAMGQLAEVRKQLEKVQAGRIQKVQNR